MGIKGKTMRIGFYLGELHKEQSGGGFSFQSNFIDGLLASENSSSHEFYFYYKIKKISNLKMVNMFITPNLETEWLFPLRMKLLLSLSKKAE